MDLSLCRLISLLALTAAMAGAQDLPSWVSRIRPDHPRLFFNADTWPAVKARAEGAEQAWYQRLKSRVDGRLGQPLPDGDHGVTAAETAFVFRMTSDPRYLDLAKEALAKSLDYYEQCYAERKSVNWYATSRNHATFAWDWLYNELTPAERESIMGRLVDVIDGVLTVRPRIYRENISGYNTGFYGVNSACWYIGFAAYGSGIREPKVNEWLVKGNEECRKLLAHRRMSCGDDGGAASPTLGYSFGAYPWAEQNYFYIWLSCTGENIAPQWPHSAWLANYVLWNWIDRGDQNPLEFGYGDTPHTDNVLPTWQLYTHMANIRHLYGQEAPEAAALARYLQERLPASQRGYSSSYFIYPFLLTDAEHSPPAMSPDKLPKARNFDAMGQIYLRSGTGPDDTYMLFTCGGDLAKHRQYDALNFVIYKHGHQAMDTGTRWEEFRNGKHLAQYFAQSVAHNVVLLHEPDEPTATYWGWPGDAPDKQTDYPCYGGQSKQLGSKLTAFETNDQYSYVAGDGTACYRATKAAEVTRQIVFLMPNRFVIFDRVTSTNPAFRKAWLLHPGSEPRVDGQTCASSHLDGRMLCRTLLPRQAQVTVVGGPGNEFRTGKVNWDIYRGEPGARNALKPEQLAMIGEWRVEVSPAQPRTDDLFLHLIEVGDQGLQSLPATQLIEADGEVGVSFTAEGKAYEVRFATAGELRGSISIDGQRHELRRDVTPQVGILALPE